MTEQALELLQKLHRGPEDEELLRLLCDTACGRLERLLTPGVTAEDVGQFPLAAAWLAMDWLRELGDGADITALSAGGLTVRREGGTQRTGRRALELLGPWLRDEGFVFRRVSG